MLDIKSFKVLATLLGALLLTLLLALLLSMRYYVVPVSNQNGIAMYRVDRFTGAVVLCSTSDCSTLQIDPPPAPPAAR